MAGRFIYNVIHLVWSTHNRREWISESWEDRLYGYLGGIARKKNVTLLRAGGMPDHLHLLVSLPPTTTISEIVNALKSNSSRWVHNEIPQMDAFGWQEGYGAFSVSRSSEETVANYIGRQKEHHRRRDFQAELLDLLNRHDIEYDPNSIWT